MLKCALFDRVGWRIMKVLISSIGTRGDVQPILALAIQLRARGHEASVCAAPNFREWVESFGVSFVPLGPDLRNWSGGKTPAKRAKPTLEQMRQLAAGSIREQFRVLGDAARGCDAIVAGGALQLAARSIAEALGTRYIFAAYCPVTLPSPDHPPPKMGSHHPLWLPSVVNRFLWKRDERRWNTLFGDTLAEERAKIGLPPLPTRSVQPYVFSDRPWLASDATLAPAPRALGNGRTTQTGAWLLRDDTPLPPELETFLARGEPPIYFGFGSVRASEVSGQTLVDAAREVGRRAIISAGWGELGATGGADDCLTIGDVNHEQLLPRVAAIVHHGGAGTTTSAALSGRPQVVLPHLYDQYYWADRIRTLGVGVSGPPQKRLTKERLVAALRACLRPRRAARARELAARIATDGTLTAAKLLEES